MFIGLPFDNAYLMGQARKGGFAENPNIGGPNNLEMLFSEEEIKDDFWDFEIIELQEVEVELEEGNLHNGFGSVIRFVGRKAVNG